MVVEVLGPGSLLSFAGVQEDNSARPFARRSAGKEGWDSAVTKSEGCGEVADVALNVGRGSDVVNCPVSL